jgi:hypothetical protein
MSSRLGPHLNQNKLQRWFCNLKVGVALTKLVGLNPEHLYIEVNGRL